MKDIKVERVRQGAAMLRRQFLQGDAGVFDEVLGDREVAAMMSDRVEAYRERIYPPLDTLRLFVGQVLSADRACQDMVGRRLSERVAQGQSASAQYRLVLRRTPAIANGLADDTGCDDR